MQIDEIKKLHQAGKLSEAKKAYLDVLAADPDNVEALQFLAILCAEEENFNESRQYLEKAIEMAPDQIALRLNLANILKAQNKLEEAEDLLLQIINTAPESAAALNNLGTIYFAQKEWSNAIQAYQQAIDVQPDYADAYYNLGLAFGKSRQLDKALNVYDALITLAPGHVGAQFQRACILMQRSMFGEAAALFADIEETFPHHFETQTNLAACCLRLGSIERSKEHYLKAIELMSDDVQSLFNLGVISMQQGRVKEAINYYLQCLSADPDHFEAHNNLGAAYLVVKDREAAIRHFKEAVRLRPNDEAVKRTLDILTGNQPLSASSAYIESLFDSYADHYDSHVLETLHYQVPSVISEMLKDAAIKESGLDILDLGCGTGLCGELLKSHAGTLLGIDMSIKMLEAAAAKKCYTKLVQDDFVAFLGAAKDHYDLIVAGDAMVYLADLSEVFAGVKRVLKPDGIFIFNIEKHEGVEEAVPVSGRFAHHPDYIEKLVAGHGLNVLSRREVALRTQEKKPVQGVVYLLQPFR